MKTNIAFENEMIIVNEAWIPQNYINWKIASKVVIDTIKLIVPEIIEKWWIDQELDACQIEIRNIWPKESLEEAQSELVNFFGITNKILKNEFWLQFSENVVPNQNFEPIHSDKIDRYAEIHDALSWVWIEYRKATNIAWLHLNMDSTLEDHLLLCRWVHAYFIKNLLQRVWMWADRFQFYKKTIEGINASLNKNIKVIPYNFRDLNEMKIWLLDANGEPFFDYNLLRLKKIKNQYISELRTFDWWVNEQDLINKTSESYQLITDIKEQFIP